jgi:hypothetical protein
MNVCFYLFIFLLEKIYSDYSGSHVGELEMIAFWYIAPCSPAEVHGRLNKQLRNVGLLLCSAGNEPVYASLPYRIFVFFLDFILELINM